MRTTFFYLILTTAITTLNSCSVYNKISSTYDETTDFLKYKTFAWLPDKTDTADLPYNNSVIHNNIRNYFGQSFAARGLKVDLENPDLLLRVSVVNKKQEKTTLHSQYPNSYYYYPYYYGSTYYFPYYFDYYYRYSNVYYTEKTEYLEGSITLEVFDKKEKKLIWTGTAAGDIYDPYFIYRDIHPAVIAIMKKFPVKEIKK